MAGKSATIMDRIALTAGITVVSRYRVRGGATRADLAWTNDGANAATVATKALQGKLLGYPAEIVNDGAQFYFRLQEAVNAPTVVNSGVSGGTNALTGILSTASPIDPFYAVADKSLPLGAVSINLGNSIIFANRLTWAFECFVKTSVAGPNQNFYVEGAGFAIGIDSSGLVRVTPASGTVVGQLSGGIPVNTWTHIEVQNAGGTFSMYMNGILDHSAAWTQGLSNALLGSNIGSSSNIAVAEPAFYVTNTLAADAVKKHYTDQISGVALAQIESNSIAAGASLTRTYGTAGTQMLPETLYMEYDRGSGDTHLVFSATYYEG